jgi:hypothetical protein
MKSEVATSQFEQDSSQLEDATVLDRLSMTPEERIDAHENARQLLEDLKNAGEELRAKSQEPT